MSKLNTKIFNSNKIADCYRDDLPDFRETK